MNEQKLSTTNPTTKTRLNLPFIPDAFVEKSKLPSLKDEAHNQDTHGQQERVNTTKTEQRCIGRSH